MGRSKAVMQAQPHDACENNQYSRGYQQRHARIHAICLMGAVNAFLPAAKVVKDVVKHGNTLRADELWNDRLKRAKC